jgi:adenosylhomocysteine nucleosidase
MVNLEFLHMNSSLYFCFSMTNHTHHNTLIIFALEVEAQGQFNNLNLLYSGVGKVNAAYRFTHKLAQWQHVNGSKPKLVLNLGSAGSTQFKAGTIVNCTHFIQRDFDTTALGTALYTTPYEETPVPLVNGLRFPAYPEGICGTGDNFSTNGHMPDWNVVDMEAFALAKICKLENIPFGCLKYITDGADGQAAPSWEARLSGAAERLHDAAKVILDLDERVAQRTQN